MEWNSKIKLALALCFIAGVFAGQGIGAKLQYESDGNFLDNQASIQNNTFEVPGHGSFTVHHANVTGINSTSINEYRRP